MAALDPLRPALGVAAGIAILHGAAAWGVLPALHTLELKTYDVMYVTSTWLRPPAAPDERLLLLTYDERAREAEKTLELPSMRHTLAAVVERAADLNARAVFLDYLLEQPMLGELGQRLETAAAAGVFSPEDRKLVDKAVRDLQPDERLAAAMTRVPTVLIFGCAPGVVGADSGWRLELAEKSGAIEFQGTPGRWRRAPRLRQPHAALLDAAAYVAHSCEFPDRDLVLRRDPAFVAVTHPGGAALLPSAPTLIAREVLGLPRTSVFAVNGGLQLGERMLPLDLEGDALVGYSGPAGSFRGRLGKPSRYSVADFLLGSPETLRPRVQGRILLVGDAMQGMRDAKLTPFGSARTPGVEKIAMQADYLVRPGAYLARPPWATRFGFLLTILAGTAAALLGTRAGLVRSLLLLPGVLVIFAFGVAALAFGGVWIDTGFVAITWAASLMTAALLRNAEEARARRLLEEAFERYVPPEMVRSIMRDPSALKLAGEEREMTVLFADLRDFTTFSEDNAPGQVVSHLNAHLTLMSEVIHKHGGTVDKFIGDAVMAFWGAPIADPDHAVHACEAAREMLEALDRRNEERIVRGLPMLDMGIGLNSGPMIVGNMGSERRFNYTVIGDAVNLASRLESLTKEQHVRILAGPRVRELAAAKFAFTPLGEVTVKGKQDRVAVFSLAESAKAPSARPASPRGSATAAPARKP